MEGICLKTSKVYDRDYFDKWYRSARHAVNTRDELQRKVALAVAATEYYLGRRIRNVLDVGCGEGVWRKPLQSVRPGVDYLGLDSSEYAVARYGRARNLRLATFGQLGELRFDTAFDLIVCSDVLHYVPMPELKRGLRGIAEMLDGVAFLELFTAQDAPAGDKHGFMPRTPNWYRSAFAQAGLIACGTHCYVGPRLKGCVAALESIDRR
ncbi:MAG TPA: class I SAM-dependent methyltransferase [Nevskia sp.]|nr:class I SAM-dependent methyltransferase [Nevskia sp.]